MEVTVTLSETEALLLEQTLIKELKPPYNIVLRDDKSYPYIFLSDQEYPRLTYHRGAKRDKGRYFGPYPNSGAVRETLNILQKLFKVRQCEDSFFRNRSRPCLQHQIGRCSAPCVRKISTADYAEDIRHTKMFLDGRSNQVAEELISGMEDASEQLDYEKAAAIRDQVQSIRRVQAQQYVTGEGGDVDVFGMATASGRACIQVFFVRDGRVLGSKDFLPNTRGEEDAGVILNAFIAQYYLGHGFGELPVEIIVPIPLEDEVALCEAIREQRHKKLVVSHSVRGHRAGWQRLARVNAEQRLKSYLSHRETVYHRFEALQALLKLDDMPRRLECFDVSHTQGEGTVASCVVFDQNGPLKSDYRRFNIEGVQPGDDYAAMAQALTRRYTRLKKGEGLLPDILVIDGGKGQLSQASRVLEELQVAGVLLLGVAKGSTRKPGLETLYLEWDSYGLTPEGDNPGFHLIQHIRDEAHRFAITSHRKRRDKKRKQSILEGIPGIGPKRRRQLLTHFGGIQEIQRASQEELANVKGISKKMAEDVYMTLHNV